MITVRLCTAALGVSPPTTLPPEEASPGCNFHSPSDQQLPLQSDTGAASQVRGQPGEQTRFWPCLDEHHVLFVGCW